jgi:hypothetical protein
LIRKARVTLTPGQSVPVNVGFDPKAIGSFAGTLTIAGNALNSPAEVGLLGTGVAQPAQHSVMLKRDAS